MKKGIIGDIESHESTVWVLCAWATYEVLALMEGRDAQKDTYTNSFVLKNTWIGLRLPRPLRCKWRKEGSKPVESEASHRYMRSSSIDVYV